MRPFALGIVGRGTEKLSSSRRSISHANAHLSSILSIMDVCVVCVFCDSAHSYPSVKIVELLSFFLEARERRIPRSSGTVVVDTAVYIMRGHTMLIFLKSQSCFAESKYPLPQDAAQQLYSILYNCLPIIPQSCHFQPIAHSENKPVRR